MMEGSSKLDRILMECIRAIEEKGWTVEDCLYRYPDLRQDLKPMLEAAIRLRRIRSLEPSNRFQRETLSRMQLRLKASHRLPKASLFQKRAQVEQILPKTYILPRRKMVFRWALPLLIAAFTVVASAGGLSFVANAAEPGDVLYQLDQTIEQVQIKFQPSVQKQIKLYLAFASERLDEAFGLIESGKSDHVILALQGYEKNIHAAETLIKEDGINTVENQQLAVVLDETFEAQTLQLQELAALVPSSDQTSIQAAILKVSDIRIVMTLPTSTATPTTQVIQTQVSPQPSGTLMPTATRPPRTTPIADGTPAASATAIPPTTIPPTTIPPTAISATPYVSPTHISATAYVPATPTSGTAWATPTVVASNTPTVTKTPSPTITSTITSTPLPDLIIEPIGWPSTANAGILLNLSYRVSNVGTATVGDGFINQLYVDDIKIGFDDKQIGSHYGIRLNPGESDTYGFVWRTTCGVHELYAITDDTHLFSEKNENNNETNYHIIVIACGTPPEEE